MTHDHIYTQFIELKDATAVQSVTHYTQILLKMADVLGWVYTLGISTKMCVMRMVGYCTAMECTVM